MKDLNYFIHLNEAAYSKRNTMEEWYSALRSNHKRSSYVEDWITSVQDIISGKVDELPRNHFKVNMGNQYGYEWLDSLVEYGFLTKVKKGRKEFVMSPDGKEGSSINKERAVKQMLDEMKAYRRRFFSDGFSYSYDEKKEEWNVSVEDMILTWFHHEKGHGEEQSEEEIQDSKEKIQNSLKDSMIVETIMGKFKEAFGSAKFMIWDMESDKEGRFGRDSHKGYMYKVTGKITK